MNTIKIQKNKINPPPINITDPLVVQEFREIITEIEFLNHISVYAIAVNPTFTALYYGLGHNIPATANLLIYTSIFLYVKIKLNKSTKRMEYISKISMGTPA